MDGRGNSNGSGFGGGKVTSVKSVTRIPVNDVFLQHDSKAQVTNMNLYSLSENG